MRSHLDIEDASPVYDNTQDDYEYKKVKYMKLIPKNNQQTFEYKFQDVIKKGLIYSIYED
jgi:hypothetical protein